MFKQFFLISILGTMVLFIAACAGTNPTPAPTFPAPTVINSNATVTESTNAYQTQSNDAGEVTVQVTPVTLLYDKPIEFEIVMNTHSVELDADMLQGVILRDDAGNEFKPQAWDGPGAGGHHRAGKLTFGNLPASVRSVTLVLKNIAKVPERVFTWKLEITGTDAIPQTLGAFTLVRSVQGPAALREFSGLHNKEFALIGGYRADYADGKQTATLWVAQANDETSALALTQDMAKKIGAGNRMFQNLQTLSINGREIYVVDGQGQQHYFYAKGDKIVWLAIHPTHAPDALHALWNTFQ